MYQIIGGMFLSQVAKSVTECVEEAYDYVVGEDFSEMDIINIKRCRTATDVTDEHLAYELNVYFKRHVSVITYRKIWTEPKPLP